MRGENEIKTPRLRLRPLRGDDADALARGVGPFEVSKWLSTVPHPYGLTEARDFIEHARTRPDTWAIEQRGRLVGTISIGSELGYWLAQEAWGQGIATEAGFAVLDKWFADPAGQQLAASHFAQNTASGVVLEKLGFIYTGERRQQHARSRGETVESCCMVLTRVRWKDWNSLPELVTPRCRLRPLRPEDAEAMAGIGGEYDVARNTSSIPSPWPVAEARDWIAQGQWQGTAGFRLGICDRAGKLIGMAGLSPMDEDGVSSLAYLLEKSLWGRGIVTEVMARFLPAMFRAFPLTAIEADHDTDNPASGAVLRKLGFRYTGDRITDPTRLRLEPTPVSHYRLERSSFEAST
ncbi:GNAT family N-acetyltransferase [Tropicimonas sp. TH_r6]|uniref:GNAT family N-acetyltransferase n=1 Tax=Tropicimonas sp. TH_r6 TaxID=3082085 RepID=UPI002952BBF1|nr:GNAT family N-acetyltransferase [Tropicimonas sp. TH_r6]MDV7141745.1 GNAT family N-acetyltransferase [Tropicimonas sp. TH_r6]